jgi:endonuclease YncB( thermonuclease family)
MQASLSAGRIAAQPPLLLYSVAAIMQQAPESGKPRRVTVFPLSGMDGLCEHGAMRVTFTTEFQGTRRAAIALCAGVCMIMLVAVAGPADAAGCAFEAQGDGHVAGVIDARTFRLADGREIRLAGIEPVVAEKATTNRASALTAILAGRDVTLRADDDTPDRYGREPAFVFLVSSKAPPAEALPAEALVQGELLAQGEALVSATVTDKACAAVLMAAEATAREAKRGIWADPTAIKNTESPGDILAGIGRFTVVEGKVLSVRQAGATTYLNFGRNWTRDFAVTIPRRVLPAFEAAGIALKSLENRRIRVRGWVEARGGPRIEVLRVGQIELLGGN